jgi:hypothetical protein
MRKLSRRRRLTVIAASLGSSSAALLAITHSAVHTAPLYTLAGVVTGMTVGTVILLFCRKRSLCA